MLSIDHSARAHSPWGASSASRWMACPASVQLSQGIVEEESPFAAEGTCAHELAEKALVEAKDCKDYIGQEFHGHTVDEEMAQYVQIYVDYVRKQARGNFKDLIVEERFDLSHIAEGLFGTNDACVSEYMGTLEVIDLKYGRGVEVLPNNNPQLLYYAIGAAKGGEYNNIKLTIVQPRVENPIKSWECKPSRLDSFAEELELAVERTKEENPKMVTGSHCKFCKAKAICPKMKEEAQEVVKMSFDVPVEQEKNTLPSPSKLDGIELSYILDRASFIREWLDSVEKYAYGLLQSGEKVINYKLVRKRSNRAYTDEQKVIAQLEPTFGDKIYKKSLIGIPAMEKLVGKELLADFIYTPEAGTTIAPESDKRPAVINNVKQSFIENPINQDEDFSDLSF